MPILHSSKILDKPNNIHHMYLTEVSATQVMASGWVQAPDLLSRILLLWETCLAHLQWPIFFLEIPTQWNRNSS